MCNNFLTLISIAFYGVSQIISVQSSEGQQPSSKVLQDFTQADGFIFLGAAEKSSTNYKENFSGFELSSISTSAPGTSYGRRKFSHISTFEHCIRNCPSSKESKPVCGNDGVIYDNAQQVHCARICGKYVQIKPCDNESTTESVLDGTTAKNSPEKLFSICKKACPISNKYSPVCGSDGITYDNLEAIKCVQTCGKQITIASDGICTFSV